MKVIAATIKPPARPDKPAESIRPVQPAQPVQANHLEQQAKPVQPVQPVVQANQHARPTTSTSSWSSHSSTSSPHMSPLQAKKLQSPRNSITPASYGVSNGVANSHLVVSNNNMCKPVHYLLYCWDKVDYFDGHALTPAQRVFEELVATERVYVKDLASVLEVCTVTY